MCKTCTRCVNEKPDSAFPNCKRSRDGLSYWCRPCWSDHRLENIDRIKETKKVYYEANKEEIRAASKAWRKANPERFRATVKAWELANKSRLMARAKIWRDANKDRLASSLKKRRKEHPIKRKAIGLVAAAIRDGRLFRQCCGVCGEMKTDAHHPDYSKPLDVQWLCSHHHHQWHLEHGPGING